MASTNPKNETAALILRAAIDGITKSYIDSYQKPDPSDPMALSEYVPMLVLEEMLVELSDKSRNFKAYKTTERGMHFLRMYEHVARKTSQVMTV